jgi:hypothetical protein
MALYIPHSIFHLARLFYVRPETFGPYVQLGTQLNRNQEKFFYLEEYIYSYVV